jgi:hypothetical protein
LRAALFSLLFTLDVYERLPLHHPIDMSLVLPTELRPGNNPRQLMLRAATQARLSAAAAEVEARAAEIEAPAVVCRIHTQTDSDTTDVYSDGGHRVPALPRYSRRPPIVYTALEAAENERRTRLERKRRKLLGRRSSSLSPADARAWLKWLRHLNRGWASRKWNEDLIAYNANVRREEAPPLPYGYGLGRMYIPDL